jgi:hypothetical protein
MAVKTLIVGLKGIAPLLMHNSSIAMDPLNPRRKMAKTLATKKKKSDEDFASLMRLEWENALYLDDRMRPVIPGEMLEACIADGFKVNKLGKVAKAAVSVPESAVLEYGGSSDLGEMFGDGNTPFVDKRPVVVQRQRILRTRPRFNSWRILFEVMYDAEMLDHSEVETALVEAGARVGIGDYRPKFGRFEVESVEEVA